MPMTQEPIDGKYLPYIFGPMFFWEDSHKIWLYLVQYLHFRIQPGLAWFSLPGLG